MNNHVLLSNLDETRNMSFICSDDEESDGGTTNAKDSNIDIDTSKSIRLTPELWSS